MSLFGIRYNLTAQLINLTSKTLQVQIQPVESTFQEYMVILFNLSMELALLIPATKSIQYIIITLNARIIQTEHQEASMNRLILFGKQASCLQYYTRSDTAR